MQRAKENLHWVAGKVYARLFPAQSCADEKKKIIDDRKSSNAVVSKSPEEIKKGALDLAAKILQRLKDNPLSGVLSEKVLNDAFLHIQESDIAVIGADLNLIDFNIMQVPQSEGNKKLRRRTIEFVELAKSELEKLEIKTAAMFTSTP